MTILITALLFVVAVALLVAVLEVIAGIVVLILGVVIATYLWNRYIRDSRSGTSFTRP